MTKRVDSHGMRGPRGVRYSWVYWAAIAAAFALLIVDIFDDGAIWNYGVMVFVIIAIAVRPGGIRGPRGAAADTADEPAPRSTPRDRSIAAPAALRRTRQAPGRPSRS